MILTPEHIKHYGKGWGSACRQPALATNGSNESKGKDTRFGADGIHFLMHDGPTEVVCRIDLDALSQFGRTIGLTEPTEIFETGRAAIEPTASDKYERTTRCHYEALTVTIYNLGLDDA
jgi:hypothetical protein